MAKAKLEVYLVLAAALLCSCSTVGHQGTLGTASSTDPLNASQWAHRAGTEFPNEPALTLQWPVTGQLSSPFGRRGFRMHTGIDIRAPQGTPVRAAAAGKVSFVGWKRGYGRTVVISHGPHQTLYAHLSKTFVKIGQGVAGGSSLGAVGRTGNASGAHLHFEHRLASGSPVDPLPYLERAPAALASRDRLP